MEETLRTQIISSIDGVRSSYSYKLTHWCCECRSGQAVVSKWQVVALGFSIDIQSFDSGPKLESLEWSFRCNPFF